MRASSRPCRLANHVFMRQALPVPLFRPAARARAGFSAQPKSQDAARRLVVVALEFGAPGRRGDETEAFLQRLAQGKALASPEAQRGKVAGAASGCRGAGRARGAAAGRRHVRRPLGAGRVRAIVFAGRKKARGRKKLLGPMGIAF